MRVWILVLLVAAALAGCTRPYEPSVPGYTLDRFETGVDDTRERGEHWMVWIHGAQSRDPPPGHVCDVAWDHSVDPGARRVDYHNGSYAFDPGDVRVLVAWDVFDGVSCPLAYALDADPSGPAVREVGRLGNLSVEVQGDGALVLDGTHVLERGTGAHLRYDRTVATEEGTRRFEGNVTVELLGAWSQDGLQPGRP